MSAETLRKAAALMRERAEAATPGPWASDQPGTKWRTWDGNVETHHPDFEDVDNTICKALGNDDSQHIASWHPAVALAVADWLDAYAERLEVLGHAIGGNHGQALAVARAYLGADQ